MFPENIYGFEPDRLISVRVIVDYDLKREEEFTDIILPLPFGAQEQHPQQQQPEEFVVVARPRKKNKKNKDRDRMMVVKVR